MSLLSSFIANHLVATLEAEFLKHEPDMQAAFVNEVQAFAVQVGEWLNSKLNAAPKAE